MKNYKTSKKAIVLLIVSIIVIAVLAIVAFFALKNDKPSVTSVTSNDEEEIKRVIETYIKATGEWDYETAAACVDKNSPQRESLLYDREENLRNIFEEHGYMMNGDKVARMTREDADAVIESSKKLSIAETEKIDIKFIDINVDGDSAEVKLKIQFSQADTDRFYVNGDWDKYMDEMYIKYCGMNMDEALNNLSIEEFGHIRRMIEIEKNEEIIKNGYYKIDEFGGKIELKRINGKWLLYGVK